MERLSADVEEILGPKLSSFMTWTFGAMTIAEEEIEAAGGRRGNRVWGAFKLMRPPEGFSDKSLEVYRAHARELVARVKAGEDTRSGTAAEILVGMYSASLAAPLTTSGMVLYEWAFEQVFGRLIEKDPTREAFAGQRDDLIAEARRKVRQDWRKVSGGVGNTEIDDS